eukprot:1178642-Prorocentrum_minimum.AAC.1
MDQSDAGSVGIFSWRTNRTQEARVYSHDGTIGRRKRGYGLMMDQSDAGSAGVEPYASCAAAVRRNDGSYGSLRLAITTTTCHIYRGC